MAGNVFDIQRYSIHDGEGIRTVVFLKGCPLRCKWCANPESWTAHPQLFYVKSRCIGCRTCLAACRQGEVEATEEGIRIVRENCTGDLAWTDACPTGALCVKGRWMDAEEVMSEVCKDEVFYRHSGGGVTLSGGEPLLQAEFAVELLSHCKNKGISTAVETTGHIPWEVLEKAAPFTDLFLYDLKSMDTRVHREWTGKGNEKILGNLKKLAALDTDIMVRTPMIPGVNDSREEIRAIMDFLKECHISKYNILPFHQYGSGKYESIGIPYALAEQKVHEEAYVQEIQEMIEREGFSRKFHN